VTENTQEEPKGHERLYAVVEGNVQGVGFRYFVQEKASSLFLTGWVRNRWDGTVEVTAEGERRDLENLLRALQRGPRPYTSTNVKAAWQAASGEFFSFQIRSTV
jgi:acylphosphatase